MANYVTSWKLPLPLVLQKPEKFGDDKEVQVTCIDFVTAVSRQNSFKGSRYIVNEICVRIEYTLKC